MITINFKHEDEIIILESNYASCSDSHLIYSDLNKSHFPKTINGNETKEFEILFIIESEWKQPSHGDITETFAKYYDEQIVTGTISLQHNELVINIKDFNYDLNWSRMTIYKGLLAKNDDITGDIIDNIIDDIKKDFYNRIPFYFNPKTIKESIIESLIIE